jgi:transcriptional regulator with PAS, ATPase and Fis domain
MARRERDIFSTVIGQSRPLLAALETARRAAETDANVYIHGESGTGKELIARAIHQAGPRRDRPLVTFDATAVPEGLMESQVFGHVKGAFTGAVQARRGLLHLANSGSLFIDEIGELSLQLQAKLLRAIQFREFTMVGEGQRQSVDVRFITATSRDLRREVAEGKFRADLYYRIAVIQIVLAPLRQRREDIPVLAEHFVERFARQYRKPVSGISARARDLLQAQAWPGNIRQLENLIEQAVIFCDGALLDTPDVAHVVEADGASESGDAPDHGRKPIHCSEFSGQSLRDLEAWYIGEVLKRFEGNRTKTARFIGVSLRGLQYKLKRYDLAPSA